MEVDFDTPVQVTRKEEVVREKTGGKVTLISIDPESGTASITLDVGESEPVRIHLDLMERPEGEPGMPEPQPAWKESVKPLLDELASLLHSAGLNTRS